MADIEIDTKFRGENYTITLSNVEESERQKIERITHEVSGRILEEGKRRTSEGPKFNGKIQLSIVGIEKYDDFIDKIEEVNRARTRS